MASTKWVVTDAKTGEELGRIERFRKNNGDLRNPCWRVWFQLEGNPSVNADARGVLAAYLGGSRKTKSTPV